MLIPSFIETFQKQMEGIRSEIERFQRNQDKSTNNSDNSNDTMKELINKKLVQHRQQLSELIEQRHSLKNAGINKKKSLKFSPPSFYSLDTDKSIDTIDKLRTLIAEEEARLSEISDDRSCGISHEKVLYFATAAIYFKYCMNYII